MCVWLYVSVLAGMYRNECVCVCVHIYVQVHVCTAYVWQSIWACVHVHAYMCIGYRSDWPFKAVYVDNFSLFL